MLPALFTSAVAVSVALGVSQRSPPAGSLWIAVVAGDGAILVSRSNGASAMVVARCPAPPRPVEVDTAPPDPSPGQGGIGYEPDTARVTALGLDTGEIADSPDADSDPWYSTASADPFLDIATSSPGRDRGDAGDTSEALPLAGPARSALAACGLPRPPAHIAWSQDTLHVACAAGPVYRWREDTGAWPVQLTAQGAAAGLPGPSPREPDRIVAMLGGSAVWLADASQRLWLLEQGDPDALRQAGTVPEPVAALAEWQGALVAAGATAIWRRSGPTDAPDDSWEPLVTVAACALSADRESLWLAGPAGLTELIGQEVRVHAVAPATGIAVRDGEVWLASGRGPLVQAPLDAAASALLAAALRRTPASEAAGVATGDVLRALRTRARRARWLPEVVARARWSRSHDSPGVAPAASAAYWPDASPGSHAGELALFVSLTWKLDPDDPAALAAAWSSP